MKINTSHEHLPLPCSRRYLKVAKFQAVKNKAYDKRFSHIAASFVFYPVLYAAAQSQRMARRRVSSPLGWRAVVGGRNREQARRSGDMEATCKDKAIWANGKMKWSFLLVCVSYAFSWHNMYMWGEAVGVILTSVRHKVTYIFFVIHPSPVTSQCKALIVSIIPCDRCRGFICHTCHGVFGDRTVWRMPQFICHNVTRCLPEYYALMWQVTDDLRFSFYITSDAIAHILHFKRRPFALQKMAFGRVKGGV